MEILLPTDAEIADINQNRGQSSAAIQDNSSSRNLQVMSGVCSVSLNAYRTGRLDAEEHAQEMHRYIGGVDGVADDNGERAPDTKPRTGESPFTGILHQPGGAIQYTRMAQRLTAAGVALAAEVMDEVDLAIAGPWLTTLWSGARNLEATGTRYLMRPTVQDQERGIVPAPVLVKNGRHGTDGLVPAIRTLLNPHDVTRTRLTLQGPQEIVTRPVDSVGVILRGQSGKSEGGELTDLIRGQVIALNGILKAEFPGRHIPVYIDTSHDMAKLAGGGELGQLRIVEAIAGLFRTTGLGISGVLMETHRYSGKQPENGTEAGKSITDECVSEVNARKAIDKLADAWLSRRAA